MLGRGVSSEVNQVIHCFHLVAKSERKTGTVVEGVLVGTRQYVDPKLSTHSIE